MLNIQVDDKVCTWSISPFYLRTQLSFYVFSDTDYLTILPFNKIKIYLYNIEHLHNPFIFFTILHINSP